MYDMLMVRVFEDLILGEGIVACEGVVVELGGTENVIRLLKEPLDLGGREDDFWMAGEVWEDVG